VFGPGGYSRPALLGDVVVPADVELSVESSDEFARSLLRAVRLPRLLLGLLAGLGALTVLAASHRTASPGLADVALALLPILVAGLLAYLGMSRWRGIPNRPRWSAGQTLLAAAGTLVLAVELAHRRGA
jgi:hypothetical protein